MYTLTVLRCLVPRETAAFLACSVYTIQPCTPCHFTQSHIRIVHACLAVSLPYALLTECPGSFTCYCGNTGVERIPKSHRKLTPEKKIMPPLLQGFEPATFLSPVRRPNHWAIPLPKHIMTCDAMACGMVTCDIVACGIINDVSCDMNSEVYF